MKFTAVLKNMFKVVPVIQDMRIIHPSIAANTKVLKEEGTVTVTMSDGRIIKGDHYLDGVDLDNRCIGFLIKDNKICIPSVEYAGISEVSDVLMAILYYYLPAIGGVRLHLHC